MKYKITKGSGTISAANPGLGTATFRAANKAEAVTISAVSGVGDKPLATQSLNVVVPTSLKFSKASNVHHNSGSADCGFQGEIRLQPPGVSYENLEVREGSFKGKGRDTTRFRMGWITPRTHLTAQASSTEIE